MSCLNPARVSRPAIVRRGSCRVGRELDQSENLRLSSWKQGDFEVKQLILAILLTSSTVPALAQDDSSAMAEADRYYACIEEKAIEFGKDNSETADTILRAAYAECEVQHAIAMLSYLTWTLNLGLSLRADEKARKESQLRETAGNRATAALLKSRVAILKDRAAK